MDFESFHPTRKEIRAILRASRKKRVPYHPNDPAQQTMKDWGFLRYPADQPRGVLDGAPPEYLEPTEECIRYAEWRKAQRREHRMVTRRYWITTAIAIVALLVAIISLLQSVGLLSLQQYWNP